MYTCTLYFIKNVSRSTTDKILFAGGSFSEINIDMVSLIDELEEGYKSYHQSAFYRLRSAKC